MDVTQPSCSQVALRLLWVDIRERARRVLDYAEDFFLILFVLCGGVAVLTAVTSVILHGWLLLVLGWGFSGISEAFSVTVLFLLCTGVVVLCAQWLFTAFKSMRYYLRQFRSRVKEQCKFEEQCRPPAGDQPPAG